METQRFGGREELHSVLELRRYKHSDFDQMVQNVRRAGLLGLVTPRLLEARINNDPDSILIAAIGDEVVGSVYLHGTIDGHLSSFVVKSNYRGMGIGTRLICEAERIFKEKGRSVVYLKPSDTSVGFYTKLGYTKIHGSEEMGKQL